ncbi:MAG: class I SAM-dependent methyltransferase [Hamadaea sp.]|nr:class I SAM-dependent methyltransferase [Hamadaea sp.]NUR50446.1 class I SAM-dependent methyltransferase [Hamadaea sp.]NUT06820.1 class I SAM-dependent methyltransferase [Hamadaea sp.]
MDTAQHWQRTYDTKGVDEVSWYQTDPAVSLRLLTAAGLTPASRVLDVGGGASVLADRLLDAGIGDVTVLDIADSALSAARTRLGERAGAVTWLVRDVLAWNPEPRYDLWHDRAVFHFLTDPADRDRYRRVLAAGLAPGGHVVIGTFAADGPQSCSGLPVARYDADQLAAQFPGFEPIESAREEHHTPWDSVQPFTWLVLRRR